MLWRNGCVQRDSGFCGMKNFFKQIYNRIKKLDGYTNEYLKFSNNIEIPSIAYTNWGMHFAHLKDFESAVEKLETAMLMSDLNPKPCISLGVIYAKLKNYEKAEQVLKEAIKRDSQIAYTYSVLSSVYVAEDKFEEAEDALNKALRLSPKDAEIYLNYGVLYAKTKRKQKAVEMFRKSKSFNPANEHVYFLLGVMLFETGKISEAFMEFRRLADINPSYKNLNYYLALCYQKEKNYMAVLEYAQRALAEDSLNPSVYILLAQNYIVLNKKEEALKTYETGINNGIKDTEFDISYAITLFNAENYEKSKEILYSVLEKEPDNLNVLYRLGKCFHKQLNYEQAEKYYCEALKIQSENVAVQTDAGMLYYDKQDYENALLYFFKVVKHSKDRLYLYFYIANCYYRMQRYKKSAEYYEKTVEYYPNHLEAFINCAVCLLETENAKEALRKIKQAYRIDRNSEKVLLIYALCDLKSGIYRDALEKSDRLLEKTPDNKVANIIKSQALINIHRPKDAIFLLNSQKEELKNTPIIIYLFYLAYKILVEDEFSDYNEGMLKYYSDKLDKIDLSENDKKEIKMYLQQ